MTEKLQDENELQPSRSVDLPEFLPISHRVVGEYWWRAKPFIAEQLVKFMGTKKVFKKSPGNHRYRGELEIRGLGGISKNSPFDFTYGFHFYSMVKAFYSFPPKPQERNEGEVILGFTFADAALLNSSHRLLRDDWRSIYSNSADHAIREIKDSLQIHTKAAYEKMNSFSDSGIKLHDFLNRTLDSRLLHKVKTDLEPSLKEELGDDLTDYLSPSSWIFIDSISFDPQRNKFSLNIDNFGMQIGVRVGGLYVILGVEIRGKLEVDSSGNLETQDFKGRVYDFYKFDKDISGRIKSAIRQNIVHLPLRQKSIDLFNLLKSIDGSSIFRKDPIVEKTPEEWIVCMQECKENYRSMLERGISPKQARKEARSCTCGCDGNAFTNRVYQHDFFENP